MTAILHVISGLGMGGAERNLVQTALELRRRGFAQQIAYVGGNNLWSDALATEGIEVFALGVSSLFNVPRGLHRLVSLIRRTRPDVIQGWMYHGDLLAVLAHRLVPGIAARRLFWGIRASDTDKGGYGWIVAINACLSSWPDLILANSQAGLDFHRAKGYRPRRAEVLPNGIDVDRFRPDAAARARIRSALQIAPDAVVALHVARVDPMKDHATFLRAMGLLPDVQAILIGAGTERMSRPDNVRALGLRSDIEGYYAASDIIVSSSTYAEGFSNAIAEGMSAGLIPVATDVGDAKFIIGEAGQLVTLGDAGAIARALKVITELPAAERQHLGERARVRIRENFSLQHAVERYARLYAG